MQLRQRTRLIATVAGDPLPAEVELIKPMKQIDIDALTPDTPEQMRDVLAVRQREVSWEAPRMWPSSNCSKVAVGPRLRQRGDEGAYGTLVGVVQHFRLRRWGGSAIRTF